MNSKLTHSSNWHTLHESLGDSRITANSTGKNDLNPSRHGYIWSSITSTSLKSTINYKNDVQANRMTSDPACSLLTGRGVPCAIARIMLTILISNNFKLQACSVWLLHNTRKICSMLERDLKWRKYVIIRRPLPKSSSISCMCCVKELRARASVWSAVWIRYAHSSMDFSTSLCASSCAFK